jgi:hypothetical protein
MSTTGLKIALLLAVVAWAPPASAQQRPTSADQYPPNPPANHVEVRFALGKKPVMCRRFQLTVKGGERTILAGSFALGFSIPPSGLTNNDMLDVEVTCGAHKWHFSDVGPRALRRGWWWVGTDYPPFQQVFQEDIRFKDAAWIKYLMVDPIGDEPFNVYKFCPAKLKDLKPGPCYDDN